MNRSNSQLKRKSELKRSEFKRRRSTELARKNARAYLKSKPETSAMKRWKKEVRERDNNTCRWPECGETKNIHAHHIHTRKQRPDLIHQVSNGACLCFQHHFLIHNTVEGRKQGRALKLLGTETYERAQKEKAA